MKKRLLALLMLAAVCGWAIAETLPSMPDRGDKGGGGYEGDTLVAAGSDTIGPFNVGGCKTVSIFAQWKGDSAHVHIERSIDGVKWYDVSALASADLVGVDSLGIYYSKIYKAVPDTGTGQVFDYSIAPMLRMIIFNQSVALDSLGLIDLPITNVKGGALCVD